MQVCPKQAVLSSTGWLLEYAPHVLQSVRMLPSVTDPMWTWCPLASPFSSLAMKSGRAGHLCALSCSFLVELFTSWAQYRHLHDDLPTARKEWVSSPGSIGDSAGCSG